MSLVDVTLDRLPNTGTLDPQTVLDAMGEAILGALVRLGEEVLDAVAARHLHELRLPPLRVGGILPPARGGMLVESERVRPQLLVVRRGGALGDDGGGWPAGEEAL